MPLFGVNAVIKCAITIIVIILCIVMFASPMLSAEMRNEPIAVRDKGQLSSDFIGKIVALYED